MVSRVYVGNLPMGVRERDIEKLFDRYGRITMIDLKVLARPPAFAFIQFEDSRDAEDACRDLDGHDIDGNRIRVEISQAGRREAAARRGGYDDRRGGYDDRRGGYDDRRGGYDDRRGGHDRRPPPRNVSLRRSKYRVLVSGLPQSASWQDLKDHMRTAGDVVYTDVQKDAGTGTVEFANEDDMKYAIRKLDDSEFKNPFDKTHIRVRSADDRDDDRGRRRSRSRSRSKGKDRSRSREKNRGKSASRSRSRSRSRSQGSRSGSKSRSRSAAPKDDADEAKDSKAENTNGSKNEASP